MGYIRHHAIIVTGEYSWPEGMKHLPNISEARAAAVAAGCAQVSEVVGPGVNGYATFVVAPDGSKEGWTDSDVGDEARDRFIEWLRTDRDGYFSWAEVVLGSDDAEAHVERHAWQETADA